MRGAFLDLQMNFSGAKLVKFGPPKLLSSFKALSLPFGRIVCHGNKQTSSIRLGPQDGANKTPKAFAAVFGADRHFS
jgi:hypothetical protein